MANIEKRPLGILLVPVETEKFSQLEDVHFNLIIGTYEKGKQYFTSPIIQQYLHDLGIKPGTNIGKVNLRFVHALKRAMTTWYFPTKFEPRLQKIGIPALLDTKLHKLVKTQLPGYHVIGDYTIEAARIIQLEKQGRRYDVPEPIEKAYEKAKRHAIKQYQKHRYMVRRRK